MKTIILIIVLLEKIYSFWLFCFIEKFESSHKTPKFEAGDRVRIIKYKNIFSKGYAKKWSKEKFVIYFVMKTNLWMCKIKDLSKEKIIGSFYEK